MWEQEEQESIYDAYVSDEGEDDEEDPSFRVPRSGRVRQERRKLTTARTLTHRSFSNP